MKIGIVSLYYKNHNYGGLLQAYALTHYLNSHGFEAEQVTWDFLDGLKRRPRKGNKAKKKTAISAAKQIAGNMIEKANQKNYESRHQAFDRFERIIPHSDCVYTYKNIEACTSDYDAFISGSDQVWNMEWYNPENFLSFVPEDMKKISYAASMPNIKLSLQQQETLRNHLERFQSLSVREQSTSDMLAKLLDRNVEWVLDPTLLLTQDEWKQVSSPYEIKEKYILCFYLSGHQPIRTLAKLFSKKVNLPIVTFANLGGTYLTDVMFGKYKVYDAGPDAFLSLIMNAEFVLTDSFHATVFANIFRKKYFVFSRDDGKMDSRIASLLKIFQTEDRFCTEEKFNVDYLMALKDKQVLIDSASFLEMKKKSENYLLCSLQD